MNANSSDQRLLSGSGDGQIVKPTGECIITGSSGKFTSPERPEGVYTSLITLDTSSSLGSEKDDKVLFVSEEILMS